MESIKLSRRAVSAAQKFIENGGIVIFPTDTVYGFLADASNKKAVEKIYKIKKRPKIKPLAVFVKNISIAKELAEISKYQEKMLKKYWPGKYTFILKSKIKKNKTIGLRIPKYRPLNNLLRKINKPLAQTSVNISGHPPLAKIKDIAGQFKNYDVLIIDGGNLPKRKQSSIIDFTKDKIKILRK